jgi:GT2 family glycosyltransferase
LLGRTLALSLTRYQHGASGWSCFALTARAARAVGRFDENIYPVYFEDEDYELRLGLAGLRSVSSKRSVVATSRRWRPIRAACVS